MPNTNFALEAEDTVEQVRALAEDTVEQVRALADCHDCHKSGVDFMMPGTQPLRGAFFRK